MQNQIRMRPVNNNNPDDRRVLVNGLQAFFVRLEREPYYPEIVKAFKEFYQYIKLKSDLDKLLKEIDENTQEEHAVMDLLANFTKLKQKNLNMQIPSISDCIKVLHLNTIAALLKTNGEKDAILKILSDRKEEYVKKITLVEEKWKKVLLVLEENKKWWPCLKKKLSNAWQSVQKAWTGFVKPLSIEMYESTIISSFAEAVYFLGRPLITHLKVKKNRTKNTWEFKLKAIGAGIGYVFVYFMELYFIVRMVLTQKILKKLGYGVDRSNYIEHSIRLSMLNAGIILIESFYFGEFYFATMLSGMVGGVVFSNVVYYFAPDLLPMPGEEVDKYQKSGMNFVSVMTQLLSAHLVKQGIQNGVIFNKLYLREQMQGYLKAVKEQRLVDDIKSEMPSFFKNPSLWFDYENPAKLTWWFQRKHALSARHEVVTDCQISEGMLSCAPVRCKVLSEDLTLCTTVPRLTRHSCRA